MKKLFTTLLLLACIGFSVCGRGATTAEPEMPAYNSETDYMSVMIRSAWDGDIELLASAIEARNAKVLDSARGGRLFTVEDFLENYEKYAGFSLDTDYLSVMKESCLSGDLASGVEAEIKRNTQIDTLGLDAKKISMDELHMLARIITSEAGSSWLPMEWKMGVGEVVLNRVASPEFPNTIEEVLYAPNQYSNVNSKYFMKLTPFADCVDAAARLLSGERVLDDPSVVFQSGSKQGSGVHTTLYDETFGYTYLCYSSRPELYE